MNVILGYNGNDDQELFPFRLVYARLVEVLGLEVEERGSAGYNGSKIAPALQRSEGGVILIATDAFLRCSRNQHTMFGFSMAECVEGSESVNKRYGELADELGEKVLKLAQERGAASLERHIPYLVHNVRWMRKICKGLKIIRLTDIPMESENELSECDRTTTTQMPPEILATHLADIVLELKA